MICHRCSENMGMCRCNGPSQFDKAKADAERFESAYRHSLETITELRVKVEELEKEKKASWKDYKRELILAMVQGGVSPTSVVYSANMVLGHLAKEAREVKADQEVTNKQDQL